MSGASRRKGVSGEREVAATYELAGFAVRGLEGAGDHAVFVRDPRDPEQTAMGILHSEVKRYGERCKWPEWWRQAANETPPGCVTALHTRADRGEWLVTLRLDDFVRLVGS